MGSFVWHCLPLPLRRKTDDQQVIVLLPVANVNQMFPEQQRRAERGNGTRETGKKKKNSKGQWMNSVEEVKRGIYMRTKKVC